MAKAYVKHDYAVTGRDYVETDGGGDTPAGGVDYSTEEQDTGLKWLDGKSIYQITIDLETAVNVSANTDTSICSVSGLGIDTLVNSIVKANKTSVIGGFGFVDSGYFKVNIHETWIVKTVTLLYTKTE